MGHNLAVGKIWKQREQSVASPKKLRTSAAFLITGGSRMASTSFVPGLILDAGLHD